MSISIAYRGKIDSLDKVDALTTEVKDICEVMNWSYHVLNEDMVEKVTAKLSFDDQGGLEIKGHCGLKGISFSPSEKCETIWLYFNTDGYMTSPVQVAFDADEGYPKRLNWLHTKTFFAGVTTHKWVIIFFKYLKKKYLPELEVHDEAEFWDHEDERALEEKFEKMGWFMDKVSHVLEEIPATTDTQKLAEKIEEKLRRLQLGMEEE